MRKPLSNIYKKVLLLLLIVLPLQLPAFAADENSGGGFDASSYIINSLKDSYKWDITTIGETKISIPLPVILFSRERGFNMFLSSRITDGAEYRGFFIASEGDHEGKIVEINSGGEVVRPWDFSITKTAAALMLSSAMLVFIIMYVKRWYKTEPMKAPKGFRGVMEMLICSMLNDVIKPSVGKDYKFFAPYLLTVFFFIFLNNLLGLFPMFPGGANVTGNIAVTVSLALFTFFMVNIFGSREYWKEIFMPDVPVWLRSPVLPLVPILELIGIFTKPFALAVRLFANMFAGGAASMAFMALIFIVGTMSAGIAAGGIAASIILSVFMTALKLLVSFIQAYVFLMLSSVFIGLARVEPHHHHQKEKH